MYTGSVMQGKQDTTLQKTESEGEKHKKILECVKISKPLSGDAEIFHVKI